MIIPLKKEDIFSVVEDERDVAFYYEAFPGFPSCEQLGSHVESVMCLTERAFLHYLPFFVSCLEEKPLGYDTLIHALEVRLKHLSDDVQTAYAVEIAEIKNRLKPIQILRYGKFIP